MGAGLASTPLQSSLEELGYLLGHVGTQGSKLTTVSEALL